MKNKLTLSLAIFATVVAGLVFLFMILDLTAFDKLLGIENRSNSGYGIYSGHEFDRNESIATFIFSALGLAIAISGLIFYKRIDESDFKVWYIAAVIISLSFAFGLLVFQLSGTFSYFKNISEVKKISIPQTQSSGYSSGYGSGASNSFAHLLSPHDQADLDSKPWFLLIGYMFAIKSALAAVVCFVLVGSVILALKEIGLSQYAQSATKTAERTKPVSSRKLQSSIDTLTKAKALLDSGVISKTDFNKIKDRELNL